MISGWFCYVINLLLRFSPECLARGFSTGRSAGTFHCLCVCAKQSGLKCVYTIWYDVHFIFIRMHELNSMSRASTSPYLSRNFRNGSPRRWLKISSMYGCRQTTPLEAWQRMKCTREGIWVTCYVTHTHPQQTQNNDYHPVADMLACRHSLRTN